MTRKTCHFHGHVQGVGFRYSVKSLAARYAVSGYVKNRPDGSVELVMEGPEDQMNRGKIRGLESEPAFCSMSDPFYAPRDRQERPKQSRRTG